MDTDESLEPDLFDFLGKKIPPEQWLYLLCRLPHGWRAYAKPQSDGFYAVYRITASAEEEPAVSVEFAHAACGDGPSEKGAKALLWTNAVRHDFLKAYLQGLPKPCTFDPKVTDTHRGAIAACVDYLQKANLQPA